MTGNTLRFVHTCCATACCWPDESIRQNGEHTAAEIRQRIVSACMHFNKTSVWAHYANLQC
eukprot:CAMPEP_0115283184 /NCGR_PEP_ID=MMETSP0270-20121206/60239_1 /TAXON_ID=71861 /ORGANISM="Scrippsiella trochoidea, Strain CCMP3099" /LENGTH=60 /DNA_ID=CAMNT_0002700077 /DNA_START=144 /DNA_END=326 /DNA_ORIENTATION=-